MTTSSLFYYIVLIKKQTRRHSPTEISTLLCLQELHTTSKLVPVFLNYSRKRRPVLCENFHLLMRRNMSLSFKDQRGKRKKEAI